MSDKAYYIILENTVLLSKKHYSSWQEIQTDYYENFKTSFPAMTCEEIISYFADDFGHEDCWPFSHKEITEFFAGEEAVIEKTI